MACIAAFSFSTVAFASDSDDDDDEQTESDKPRKKARKKDTEDSESVTSDSDDEDSSRVSRRRRKARRADPDDEEEEEAPRKPVEEPSYSKRSGFMLQTSLVTQTSAFNAGAASLQLSGIEGGLSAGYKTGRFMLSLGFDFTDVNDTTPKTTIDPDTGDSSTVTISTSNYSFVVYPELQYALARSADQRVELLGTASVGFGSFGTRISPSNGGSDDITRLRVRWRIAPGIRYWVHPQFAVSLAAGVTNNYLALLAPRDGGSSSTSTTALYSQISIVGTF